MPSSSDSLRRVLVTGAGGFVGAHLVAALDGMGAEVTALVRNAGSFPGNVRVAQGDLSDSASLTALLAAGHYDAIFHLAGRNAAAGAVALYEANVVGTAALLQAVRALRRPQLRVVLTGSSAEYGASPDDPITEESPAMPIGDYGVSKLAATRMGEVLHATSGQDVVMVRPFNIVGPGNCANLLHADVARQIVGIESAGHQPQIRLRDLSSYRDFIDVRDVASGLIALAERGVAGQVYNLCSGHAMQAAALVEMLLAKARQPISLHTEPPSPTVTGVPYQRGSFQKTKKACAWMPSISLEKSLTDTLNYWRKCENLPLSSGQLPEAIQK